MYLQQVSNQFKTDLKVYKNDKKVINELKEVLHILSQDRVLPRKYKNHELKGEFKGIFECHVFPDVLLMYEKDQTNKVLRLVRLGSHAKLFE